MAISDSEAARLLSTADGRAIQEAVRRSLQVQRFRNGQVRDVDAVIRQLAAEIRRAARGRLERSLGSASIREVERRIAAILRDASPRILDVLAPGLRELATQQGARVGIAGARALGSTASQHFAGWRASLTTNVRGGLIMGVTQGDGVPAALQAVDAALARGRAQAASIVRTMSDSIATQAREREIERRGFQLVRYVAVLDENTTEICTELNGTVWPIGEGPRPPQHYGCRSFLAEATNDDAVFSEISLAQVRAA